MRSGAASISIGDSWFAMASMLGVAPVSPDGSSGDGRTLPLLAVCAMVLATLLLNLVRRRVAEVLETWRRDAAESSSETLRAPASRSVE